MTDYRHTTIRIAIGGRLVCGPRLGWPLWRPLIDAAAGRVLALDLRSVSQIDAAGLGLLVALAVELRQRNGRLRLMCVPSRLRTLVRTTGLGAVLGLVSEAVVARAVRRRDVIGPGAFRDLREPATCRY